MTQFRIRRLILPAALLLLGLSHTANAQTFFPNNATINYTVNSDAEVGYADASYTVHTNPTVSLVNNGIINGSLHAYNSSNVIVSGGSIAVNAIAYDNSTLSISGGEITSSLVAEQSSTVNWSGGSVDHDLLLYNSSTFNLFGTGLSDSLTNPNAFNGFRQYTLAGKLNDGTSVNGKFLYVLNGSNVSVNFINAVPEPGSVALLVGVVVTGAGVARKRRVR